MLDPEDDDAGNIEYKEYFSPKITNNRIEHLATQMKWRMSEGDGVCYYYIGVKDNGTIVGLTSAQLDHSMYIMNVIIQKLMYYIYSIDSIPATPIIPDDERVYLKFTIHSKLECSSDNEVRVCVIGPPASGKSTLIASLYSGKLDNGDGLIRHITHNHRHEIISGCTSSISETYIKNVTLYDLPGQNKYTKTMLRGLLAYKPCHILITYTEHIKPEDNVWISIATFLGIDYTLVKTKVDITTTVTDGIGTSSVTGAGITELKNFLLGLNKVNLNTLTVPTVHLEIIKLYELKGIGYVIYGIMLSGEVHVGDILQIGPFIIDNTHRFCPVIIRSIHYRGNNVKHCSSVLSIGLLVEFGSRQDSIVYNLRKRRGDVIVSTCNNKLIKFIHVKPLNGNTTKKGRVYTLMYSNVYTQVRVVTINDDCWKLLLRERIFKPSSDKCILLDNDIIMCDVIQHN